MNKILVPIDFSERAFNAFAYALEFADSINAEVVALLMGDKDLIPDRGDKKNTISQDKKPTVVVEEKHQLQEIIQQRRLKHISVKYIDQNDNRSGILETAVKEKADCIVMGIKGTNETARTFFGSLDEKTIQDSRISIFTIPQKYKFRPIKKILFSTQFAPPDILALKEVLKLAESLKAKLFFLYLVDHHREDQRKVINTLKESFRGADLSFCIIASNDIEETITDFIEMDNIDLLATPVRNKFLDGKSMWPGLTKKRLLRSDVPLMSIHEDQN